MDCPINDIRCVEYLSKSLPSLIHWDSYLENAPVYPACKSTWRTVIKDHSIIQEGYSIALLGLVEISGRPKNADTIALKIFNHLPKLASRDGVYPNAWLIKQQKSWRADHGACKAKLLFHPARQLPGKSIAKSSQIGKI
ncbi:hypothetical protein Sbs19_43530 [Sphingobium sp. BS19]|nr:hypothetical protein Sbs19_43530 [Sphingobium sp. BS19]